MPQTATQIFQKINRSWLCLEIIVDFILIAWGIALLAEIQDEFYGVFEHGGTVHVVNDKNYWGPIQIVCMDSAETQIATNCDNALLSHSPITSLQDYFSLKYLEAFRGNIRITMNDIIDDRHNLYIILSIYIVIWFCLSCAGKLQNNREDIERPHFIYYISICYLENSLATLKMMMFNIFAVSEEMEGVLLLEYIPGFSLIIFMIISIIMGCCLGAMAEVYTKYEWMKNVCICSVIFLLFAYFIMFIFPSFGLNVFALQFGHGFRAISNGLFSMYFIKKVNLLRVFALYMGVLGWIKTLTPIIWMLCNRKKSDTLLAGAPKPTYTVN